MFDSNNVIEFIGKIINQVDKNNQQDVENNLKKFRDYLELTDMCDSSTLKQIDDILECSSYLIALKLKLGYVDVASIVLKEEDRPKILKKTNTARTKRVGSNKHYNHFVPSSSSSCGGSSSYSNSCGTSTPSYSSSCGGGASYSRC